VEEDVKNNVELLNFRNNMDNLIFWNVFDLFRPYINDIIESDFKNILKEYLQMETLTASEMKEVVRGIDKENRNSVIKEHYFNKKITAFTELKDNYEDVYKDKLTNLIKNLSKKLNNDKLINLKFEIINKLKIRENAILNNKNLTSKYQVIKKDIILSKINEFIKYFDTIDGESNEEEFLRILDIEIDNLFSNHIMELNMNYSDVFNNFEK